MMNFTEVSKAISEVSKKSMDMPKFGEGVSPKNIKDFNEADKKLNVDNQINNIEIKEKLGGSYKDVHKVGEGDLYEVHHMPADSISELSRGDGPAIKMDKEDHRETASCGTSREAREYRAKQKELIEQGKFREAVEMDINDIRDKFGDKYDNAISQMLEYVDKLEGEGKI